MPVEITWLGQSGLLLQASGRAILVDPWLSPHPDRAAPPPVLARWPERIDTVLVTHGHEDHLDLAALQELAQATTLGEIVAPEPHLASIATALPGMPCRGVRPDTVLDGDPALQVFPAWHGVTVADGYDPMIAPDGTSPHVGYGFTFGDTRIFISGDTLAEPALLDRVRAFRPQLVALPVNGRDAEREARGILGNMDGAEAVGFAVAVGAEALLPLHHDGVTGNTADIGIVARAALRQPLAVLLPARTLPLVFSGTRL